MTDHVIDDASALDAQWQRAEASGGNGNCFEFASIDGKVAVRHSKAPHGPALLFTTSELAAMLDGARNGEFDHLTRP
ncbi:DUF397 domain-containing protein [Streptomyces sp. NPDC059477]|uniref:DUF397 domain-containing protein n=1 Tax=Streptomyces sp. NPDC059477 TaxID=3346847 RepID=UPI0036CE318A